MAPSFAFHLCMRLEVFDQCPYLVTGQFSSQPPAAVYHHKNPWQVCVPSFSSGLVVKGPSLRTLCGTAMNCGGYSVLHHE